MLYRENKLLIVLFIVLSFFTTCNKDKKYNEKEINEIRSNSINASISIIGKDEYNNIYQSLNDSIQRWINNQLEYYKYFNDEREWYLDSVMCINQHGNKLITSILKKSMYSGSTGDFIDYFYGAKVNNQWYFFKGPALVLPREFYQENIHIPLSFEKLKQIAADNIYRGYLIKNKQGEWEINDRFFEQVTPLSQRQGKKGLKSEEEYAKFMTAVRWASSREEQDEIMTKYWDE